MGDTKRIILWVLVVCFVDEGHFPCIQGGEFVDEIKWSWSPGEGVSCAMWGAIAVVDEDMTSHHIFCDTACHWI